MGDTNLALLCALEVRTVLGASAYRDFNRTRLPNITRASRVSGLEAFSRHPTHGSFRALAFPPTLFAGRASPLFLSY